MPPVEAIIFLPHNTKLSGTDALDYAFHQHCDICASEPLPEPLCKVCEYIRLQHLIICLKEESRRIRIYLNPETGDNPISRIMRNKDCALCRVLSNGMRSCGYQNQDEYNTCMIERGLSQINVKITHERRTRSIWFKIDISLDQIPFTAIGSLVESRPLMRSLVNWVQIQEWIGRSPGTHQREISTLENMPQGVRLIDVNKRRLTFGKDHNLAPGGFVALSYVWGNNSASPENALMQSNKQALEADGGLKQLPRTIEDAITICKQLGRPYLWVDRYCIQQDEQQEKQRQMDAMADIFSVAEFTIINASGTDMNCPIPGVTEGREALQSQAVLPGLVLTNFYPHNGRVVNNSRWARRGWTYQEEILSKKRLLFSPLQVSLASDETPEVRTSTQEDYYGNHSSKYHRRLNLSKDYPFDSFASHISKYTRRLLTHQSDILNAFMGIFKMLYPNGSSLYGLPEPDFDQALLWQKTGTMVDGPISAREGFSSWSWASYTGSTVYTTTNHTFVTTLVCWAYKRQTGELNAVRSRNRSQRLPNIWVKKYDPQFHLLLAWWAGCIEAAPPDDLEKELEVFLSSDELYISERLPSMERIWDAIKGGRDVGPERFQDLNIGLKAEDESTIGKLQHGVLLTRAQTAAFKSRHFVSIYHHICNFQGDVVGQLRLDSPSVPKDAITGTGLTTPQEEVELMGVSLSRFDIPPSPGYYKKLIRFVHKPLHTGEERQWPDIKLDMERINVLAIERPEGSSFWRRVGSGYVLLSHWVSANPTFKTIALE